MNVSKMLDGLFKFKIGAVVEHIGSNEEPDIKPDGKNDKTGLWLSKERGLNRYRLVITERHVQQCHGGVQIFYYCRQVRGDGAMIDAARILNITELELRAKK